MRLVLAFSLLLLACGGGSGSGSNENTQSDPFLGVMWQRAQKDSNCTWLKIFDDIEQVNLSFLWNSYGNDNTCLLSLFSSGKSITLRTYLSNGVCIRKNNCSEREIQSTGDIKKALVAVQALATNCPTCLLQIVPQLEDNWTHEKACSVYEALKPFTSAEIIRNPVKQSQVNYDATCYDGIELHNELPAGRQLFSGSNDGASLLLSDYAFSGLLIDVVEASRRRNAFGRSSYYFIWHALGNCLKGDTRNAPFPHQRVCEDNENIYIDLNSILQEGL